MWLLGRILPLVIGDLVPEDDENWENLLVMLKITDLLLAPTTTTDLLGYLAGLIESHHHKFRELYPNESVIPKMHFMVHMPGLMSRYVTICN